MSSSFTCFWGQGHTMVVVPGAWEAAVAECSGPGPDQRRNLRAVSIPFAPMSPSGTTLLVSFPSSELSFSYTYCMHFFHPHLSPALSHTLFLVPTPREAISIPKLESVFQPPGLLLSWFPVLFCWSTSLCDFLEWVTSPWLRESVFALP